MKDTTQKCGLQPFVSCSINVLGEEGNENFANSQFLFRNVILFLEKPFKQRNVKIMAFRSSDSWVKPLLFKVCFVPQGNLHG